jgi:hypothetical protein
MHLVDQWKNGSLVLSGLIYCWFALPVPINGTTKPVLEACVGQEWFVGLPTLSGLEQGDLLGPRKPQLIFLLWSTTVVVRYNFFICVLSLIVQNRAKYPTPF